jgi:hypothetical protein
MHQAHASIAHISWEHNTVCEVYVLRKTFSVGQLGQQSDHVKAPLVIAGNHPLYAGKQL